VTKSAFASVLGITDGPTTPAQPERRWYAAYTCAQHEKRVAEQLAEREVEHLLPLYSAVHRWKDRRVRVHLPLFPGYVFVRLLLPDRLRVLQIPSVVRLVGFGGLPTAVPDEQVEILRSGLADGLHIEPHPFLTVGRRARVVRGPLAGLEGILRRKKNNFRFVLSIELIQRSFAVDVDAADLLSLREPTVPSVARTRGTDSEKLLGSRNSRTFINGGALRVGEK
jgi:transcription antitermination factor NusG